MKQVTVDFVFEMIPGGKEITLLYELELDHQNTAGTWFNLDNLPEDIVETDVGRIRKLARYLQK